MFNVNNGWEVLFHNTSLLISYNSLNIKLYPSKNHNMLNKLGDLGVL